MGGNDDASKVFSSFCKIQWRRCHFNCNSRAKYPTVLMVVETVVIIKIMAHPDQPCNAPGVCKLKKTELKQFQHNQRTIAIFLLILQQSIIIEMRLTSVCTHIHLIIFAFVISLLLLITRIVVDLSR
jgi:hypothetical protein